jgi:hypothetical protein
MSTQRCAATATHAQNRTTHTPRADTLLFTSRPNRSIRATSPNLSHQRALQIRCQVALARAIAGNDLQGAHRLARPAVLQLISDVRNARIREPYGDWALRTDPDLCAIYEQALELRQRIIALSAELLAVKAKAQRESHKRLEDYLAAQAQNDTLQTPDPAASALTDKDTDPQTLFTIQKIKQEPLKQAITLRRQALKWEQNFEVREIAEINSITLTLQWIDAQYLEIAKSNPLQFA